MIREKFGINNNSMAERNGRGAGNRHDRSGAVSPKRNSDSNNYGRVIIKKKCFFFI